jgi:hypothetical protein
MFLLFPKGVKAFTGAPVSPAWNFRGTSGQGTTRAGMPKSLPPVLASVALFVLVGGGVAVPSARAAATAKPCWERVLDDWLDNETIDGMYSPSCYRAALGHVPEDLRDYSDIDAAISAALQDALRRSHARVTRASATRQRSGGSGSGGGTTTDANTGTTAYGTDRSLQVLPRRSIYRRAVDELGGTTADSLPIPLLVLAGLGSALLVLAIALAARNRVSLQARRSPPR